jgi:hypothetical protein
LRGEGTLKLRTLDGGRTQVTLSARIPGIQQDGVALEPATVRLQGGGTCRNGVVRVVFAAAPGLVQERFRVLGGTTVALLTPELSRGPFGQWEIDVLDGRDNTRRKMQGFWRQETTQSQKTADVAP